VVEDGTEVEEPGRDDAARELQRVVPLQRVDALTERLSHCPLLSRTSAPSRQAGTEEPEPSAVEGTADDRAGRPYAVEGEVGGEPGQAVAADVGRRVVEGGLLLAGEPVEACLRRGRPRLVPLSRFEP